MIHDPDSYFLERPVREVVPLSSLSWSWSEGSQSWPGACLRWSSWSLIIDSTLTHYLDLLYYVYVYNRIYIYTYIHICYVYTCIISTNIDYVIKLSYLLVFICLLSFFLAMSPISKFLVLVFHLDVYMSKKDKKWKSFHYPIPRSGSCP